MRNVYICEPYCVIHKNGDYLTVRKQGSKVADISLVEVQMLILCGMVQITMQAVGLLMKKEIDILLLTEGGRQKGRIMSKHGSNVLTRIAQYHVWFQEERRLGIAKELIKRKTLGQKEVIKSYRYARKMPELADAESKLEQYVRRIEYTSSASELLGLEGSAASTYFDCFGKLLLGYTFEKRIRRPAYDPVNALLNLTYTFLKNEMTAILEVHSFDLQLGFLHTVRSGRDSLALDCMEPYRPIFADRFVLNLLNKKIIRLEDFELDEEGMKLRTEAMKKYCKYFQEMLCEQPWRGEIWRKCMEKDIIELRKQLMHSGRSRE